MSDRDILKGLSQRIKNHFKDKYSLTVDPVIQKGTIEGVEFYTSLPLQLSRELKRSPLEIAEELTSIEADGIIRLEAVKPGFLNITLSENVYLQHFNDFSSICRSKNGKKVNIEFISANPTGPLNVVSGRAAAFGRALSYLFEYAGWEVTKEYYINDAGNQINIFTNSIYKAYLEKFEKQTVNFEENEYNNAYVRELAEHFSEEIRSASDPKAFLKDAAIGHTVALNKKILERIDLSFDVWFSESSLYENAQLADRVLSILKEKSLSYEKDGALFIKNTALGDSQDWVLKKSNGEYTYLFGDIMYHINKFERGFDKAINIWGPDHHGGVRRLQLALTAFDIPEDFLEIIILQQVNLIKDGEKLVMSKRSGNYIQLNDIVDSVGADAAKYFFLSKGANQHVDFSLDRFEKEGEKSPVFYVQYMFARINSILEKAGRPDKDGISKVLDAEKKLLYSIFLFENAMKEALLKREPAMVITYLNALATEFHRFYHESKIIGSDEEAEYLKFVSALGTMVKDILNMIGFNAPENM
ncbi:arginine--tRNA ligase [bacterium]|nr:arginine--tRNA ligase [bacterium]